MVVCYTSYEAWAIVFAGGVVAGFGAVGAVLLTLRVLAWKPTRKVAP